MRSGQRFSVIALSEDIGYFFVGRAWRRTILLTTHFLDETDLLYRTISPYCPKGIARPRVTELKHK